MILLIEDDAISRTDFVVTLCRCGYAVLEAEDGFEALSLIAKHRTAIELVISDMVLPGMNGFTLVQNIELLLPKVPIIMISGYISKANGEVILGHDVAFLEKPIRPSALLAAVQRHAP